MLQCQAQTKALIVLVLGLYLFFTSSYFIAHPNPIAEAQNSTAPVTQQQSVENRAQIKSTIISQADESQIIFIIGLSSGIVAIIAALVKGVRWLKCEVTKEVVVASKETTSKIEDVHTELKHEVDKLDMKLDKHITVVDTRLSFQDEQLKDLKSLTLHKSKSKDDDY